ncbi:MAG: HEPN domain-containing protein [Candidatus Woesearchaeota archaeon]
MHRKRVFDQGNKDPELAEKEIGEAEYDHEQASKSFDNEDYKWAIVKCYYSMFHAAKALLYISGFIEKKHVAIIVVLEQLSKKGEIEERFVNDFKAAMSAREDADYHYSYSKEIAETELSNCEDFLGMAKGFLERSWRVEMDFRLNLPYTNPYSTKTAVPPTPASDNPDSAGSP